MVGATTAHRAATEGLDRLPGRGVHAQGMPQVIRALGVVLLAVPVLLVALLHVTLGWYDEWRWPHDPSRHTGWEDW